MKKLMFIGLFFIFLFSIGLANAQEGAWSYCLKDPNYTSTYQYSIDNDKYIRGQAILSGDPAFPAPLTGYVQGTKMLFSIAYLGDFGLRFYQIKSNNLKGETWGISDSDSSYYDNPHKVTLQICTPSEFEAESTGDSGAIE